jgi:hypothetical protein
MTNLEKLSEANPEIYKHVHNPSLVIVHNALEKSDSEETIGFEVRNAIKVNPRIASCELKSKFVVNDVDRTAKMVRSLNKSFTADRQTDAIYRGGIMGIDSYRKFYNECLDNGLKLINNPEQSEFVESFDKYFQYIKPFTFDSVIINPDKDVENMVSCPENRKKLKAMISNVMTQQNWAKTFIRFDNMSLKNVVGSIPNYFDEEMDDSESRRIDKITANVVSNPDDIDGYITSVLYGLEFGRKYHFHFPLVLREYKEPKYVQGRSISDDNAIQRVANEYRTFVYKGEVVDVASYWTKSLKFDDETITRINDRISDVRRISQLAANSISTAQHAPGFYSLDVLELPDGTLKVVEINDGQNSGIYSSYLDKFYRRFGKDINTSTKKSLSKIALSVS